MLELDDVHRSYRPPTGLARLLTRSPARRTVTALAGVDLLARSGRVLGLVGPNGAGKSTLIRVVAGLLDPDRGRVRVDGHDPAVDRRAASRSLGLVLADDRSLYWRLTGRENLELHGALYGLRPADARARADALLEQVGLAARDGLVVGYSTGMRARLSLARALVHDPPVVVLDEPTRSLDPLAAQETCRLLTGLAAEGRTVLLSSHHLDELERTADDVVVLLDGRIHHAGPVASLRDEGRPAARRLEELLAADRPSGAS